VSELDPHPRAVEHSRLVVSGPLVKAIFTLAIPPVLGMFMEIALSVTDFYWVGHLGAAAQDAIASSMVVIWTLFSALSIICIGVAALVSRNVGANEPGKAAHFVRQAVWMALILGGLVGIIGLFSTSTLLNFMNAGDATQHHAQPYLRVFFLVCPFLFLAETAYSVFRASGDTKTPVKVGITVVVVNMLLDPLLIFGWGPVPALGVAGASIATGVAWLIGMVLIYRLMVSGRLGYSVGRLFGEIPALGSFGRIARIGLPISTQQLTFVLVYWFLIGFVHRFGEAAGAAMGIGNRMESFSYLTCSGFAMAASTLVGQNLGAGQPDRAAKGAWGATGLGISLTLVFSFFFLVLPGPIAGFFTDDPKVQSIAVGYLVILGLSQITMAVEIILEGAFSGSGDTLPPMLVILPGSVARIPLAWYLAFQLDWGINGIWWTLTITTTLKAVILAWWFKLGHWKLKKI